MEGFVKRLCKTCVGFKAPKGANKNQWKAFRGNGKKAKTVTTEAKEILKKGKRIIAVRVVDIFGNDAGVVLEV